jgi:hypothetical protein
MIQDDTIDTNLYSKFCNQREENKFIDYRGASLTEVIAKTIISQIAKKRIRDF